MKKVELSKYDFKAIDVAFDLALKELANTGYTSRIEQLKDKFAKAHTGWLEMEEEE